ncbi:MAG: 4-hydroxy-3-methylbut-2-en-1-yl diphosphate synthase [Omnitrophica bacterium RIFCSPLOWO2_01_FULL_45_10]|nr:MAG: 4-hydroxy-3-methylbut-2-en-1-yl diphosphate synthase [Omnitrophica bacterium RIFCSPLOWO2_01_FULL_45_10]
MIKRRKTRLVKVGDVRIGQGAPVSIQSMTKVETQNVKGVLCQIKRLEGAGCEIIRVAVKNFQDAEAIKGIKKKIRMPLVCDIHFNHRLALAAIENGADKIRLNPGNIRKKEEIAAIVKAAKKARIPIRIGVNSGSVVFRGSGIGKRVSGIGYRETGKVRNNDSKSVSHKLVDSALGYIGLFEDMNFRDIIISLKASDVVSTVEAYRLMAERCDYPFHLGVTASGPYESGIVKSSIGIGALLLDGIGDTLRVSLTSDPVDEVIAAKRILSSVGMRNFGPDIIACPTCGRCQVELVKIVQELDEKLYAIRYTLNAKRPLKIALMGCEVNGPGEAIDADIGVAFGKGRGMLFKKGKIVRKIKTANALEEILKEL